MPPSVEPHEKPGYHRHFKKMQVWSWNHQGTEIKLSFLSKACNILSRYNCFSHGSWLLTCAEKSVSAWCTARLHHHLHIPTEGVCMTLRPRSPPNQTQHHLRWVSEGSSCGFLVSMGAETWLAPHTKWLCSPGGATLGLPSDSQGRCICPVVLGFKFTRVKGDESLKVLSKTNLILPEPLLRDLFAKLYTHHLSAQGMVNLYRLWHRCTRLNSKQSFNNTHTKLKLFQPSEASLSEEQLPLLINLLLLQDKQEIY